MSGLNASDRQEDKGLLPHADYWALLPVVRSFRPILHVKPVQKAVDCRGKQDAQADQKNQPGKQRVKRGEYLPGGGVKGIDRPHPSEDHGGIDQSVNPWEIFKHVIPDHADRQRAEYDSRRDPGVPDHTGHKGRPCQQWFMPMLEHGESSCACERMILCSEVSMAPAKPGSDVHAL
jgi:hypothetical protein